MKKIYTCMALFAAVLLMAAGCDLFLDHIAEEDGIPEGVSFYTGCPISMYFVDENGNDLVTIGNTSTYPTAFSGPVFEEAIERAVSNAQEYTTDEGVVLLYNNTSNTLWNDPSEGKIRFQTFFWGVTPELTHLMPVYLGSSVDTLTVGYKYVTASDKVQITGASWAVDIISVHYNGVDVLLNNTTGKVFIEKPSQGGTIVHVGSI